MLYDSAADVLIKALRGHALTPAQAATRSGLSESKVTAACRGQADTNELTQLALALELNPTALAKLEQHQPNPRAPSWIERLKLTFDDDGVNAWLCDAGEGCHLIFDTGAGENDIRHELDQRGLGQVHVLITHEHADHVGGLRGLNGRTLSVHRPATGLQPNIHLHFGNLKVRSISLPGHCDGALGFVVDAAGFSVCITGDALFAGSIGGCPSTQAYQQALAALRNNVMSLPDDTLLLPGHGPATTVGLERSANPFFARASG